MNNGYFDFKMTEKLRLKIRLCERQNWRCCYCKFRVEFVRSTNQSLNFPTIEHVIPNSEYGSKGIKNTVMACLLCNRLRGVLDCSKFDEVIQELLEDTELREVWHKISSDQFNFLRKHIEAKCATHEPKLHQGIRGIYKRYARKNAVMIT
jgi:CRISPR/Cas system Type II protein with McrA/HNH and RuvC-like nuclease domain